MADTEEKIADAEEDKETQETSKDNRQKYRDSLKPKCDWMKESSGRGHAMAWPYRPGPRDSVTGRADSQSTSQLEPVC